MIEDPEEDFAEVKANTLKQGNAIINSAVKDTGKLATVFREAVDAITKRYDSISLMSEDTKSLRECTAALSDLHHEIVTLGKDVVYTYRHKEPNFAQQNMEMIANSKEKGKALDTPEKREQHVQSLIDECTRYCTEVMHKFNQATTPSGKQIPKARQR